jgi:hypothetical protein
MYNTIRKIYLFFRQLKNGQRKVSYGKENPGKTFYVVAINRNKGGLFWIILVNFSHVYYALSKNFIPFIDMQNYENQYLDTSLLHKENSWEYYFEQPATGKNYSLESIYNSKHVILSNKTDVSHEYYTISDDDIYNKENKERLLYARKLFQEYIKFNKKTKEHLDNERDLFIGKGERVLGVLCRGTDYINKKPPGHLVQPEPDEVIKKAEDIIREYSCSYIYLATEDQDIYDLFEARFGKKLLANRQKRFRKTDFKNIQYISEIESVNKRGNYLLGLEYLSSINILSQCTCFIGGRTCGTVGVYLMSGGFEYDYTWNLGRYPFEKITLRFLLNKFFGQR